MATQLVGLVGWRGCQHPGFPQSQETGAFHPHIHKGRLHAGQHALHPAQHDLADMAVAVTRPFFVADDAFDPEILKPAPAKMSDADFAGARIDEDFSRHDRSYHESGKPAPSRSATVAASGRPTTLE